MAACKAQVMHRRLSSSNTRKLSASTGTLWVTAFANQVLRCLRVWEALRVACSNDLLPCQVAGVARRWKCRSAVFL